MRKTTVLLIALALVLGASTPAFASHGSEVDGLWQSTDNDGSHQLLRLRERPDGMFSINYIDFLATEACSPDAFFRSGGEGTYDDAGNVFAGTLTSPQCARHATPGFEVFPIELTYDAATDTLNDSFGVTWHPIGG